MFIRSPKYYNLFFFNCNQSIYHYWLQNEKTSYSLYIPNSCTFCARYADLLPRAIHQHGMCSLFVNSGTYTCYSIVLFFQYNQSIYFLRLENKKTSRSFFIPNSCTFCPRYADFLPRAIHQHSMCSLFVNSGTYTYYSIVLFFQYNQSIYFLRLENEKTSHSFFIPTSCTFCPRYAHFLPRAIHQHGMCSLFVNSGTYTCYSIVLFFQYNQSIYFLRLENKKISRSFFIPNSCTFCPRYHLRYSY